MDAIEWTPIGAPALDETGAEDWETLAIAMIPFPAHIRVGTMALEIVIICEESPRILVSDAILRAAERFLR